MAAAVAPGDVVAAAPQLPKMLPSVEHFQPPRSGVAGFALFVLNPIDRMIRTWIATNTHLPNVGLLVLIAAMQISKGVQGL